MSSPRNYASEAEKKRGVAVAVHEDDAPFFERAYVEMEKDRFSSAFTYGRSKLDALLMEELRKLPAGARILDVGCGTGEQVKLYRQLGFQPAGVEPAQKMRAVAVRTNPEVRIEDGTVLDLPFPDGSFDFLTSIEVLRYLDRADWPRAYAEMLRVLRPGGSLFVTMLNRYALDGFTAFDGARKAVLGVMGREPRAYHASTTPAELRRELAGAGADRVEVYGRMFAPLRLAYKVSPSFGSRAARAIERLDDRLGTRDWHVPLAGHLIVVASRPR